MMERSALGRGLAALIPEGHQEKEKIQNIPVGKIIASEFQPRGYFSESRLIDLANSIKEKGIIQPILVRSKEDKFEIIAGERRYRAALLNGLKEVPVIVKQVNDEDLLELSLIENIQREELNRIEEAKAYKRLSEQFGMTHERISEKVSKDRTTITNILRLLELPQNIQDLLEQNSLTMGHAKAILGLDGEDERIKFSKKVIKDGLSVRQAENLIRQHLIGAGTKVRVNKTKDVHITAAEDRLQHRLGTRVLIEKGKKRGKIVIEYFSDSDLDRILNILEPTNSKI